jgi:hypothetical protein
MKERFGKINPGVFGVAGAVVFIAIAVLAIMRFDTTGEKGSGLGKAYEYDLSKIARVDPNLILYRESANAIHTDFDAARAIAVGDDGRVYVAGDNSVRIFGEGGNLAGEFAAGGAPRCLTVAEDGRVFVGFKDHVEVYDGQGKRLAVWENLGENAVLTSIAVSKNDVFVADAGDRIVLHYDSKGQRVGRIGQKDKEKNIPGFVIPSPYFDLLVGRDGLLRVVNPGRHTIEAYTFTGDLEFSWGTFASSIEGFVGCCNPVNIAMLADGSFVTCEKGLIRVKIYDPDGKFVGVVAGPEQLAGGLKLEICEFPAQCRVGGFDVAVDGKGRVLVLDTLRNVVRIFSRIEK